MITLITGTSKGIGRYLSEYYIGVGHMVVGCSRGESDYENSNYYHYRLDVSNERDVIQMVKDVKKRFGKIDNLINNAGIAMMNHLLLTPLSALENVFKTNVFGTFLLLREVSKVMIKNNYGRIVNFSTIAVPLTLEGEGIYAASKAAVETLTRISARELASFSVTVNAIGPAPIKTDLIKNVDNEKIEKLLKKQAIDRFGRFEDVSNLVDFFIKKESGFITGQVMYLGGVS